MYTQFNNKYLSMNRSYKNERSGYKSNMKTTMGQETSYAPTEMTKVGLNFNGSSMEKPYGFPSGQINRNGNFRENYQERYREINRELIKYIYSTVDISKFKYELLKHKQQLGRFISNTYYVSPNYYGKNCLLVLTKIKQKYYSFLVDRRQLSYSIDKVKPDEVFIHHCNVEVDLAIFQGTIFDGVYIKKGLHHEFIINDVYTFKGNNYSNNKLNLKLLEIKLYLDNINPQIHAIRDRINAKTNLELKVNNLENILDIRKFVKSDMKEIEKEYQTKGLCFYPEVSGTKLVYIMDENNRGDDISHQAFAGSINTLTSSEGKLNRTNSNDSDSGSEIRENKTKIMPFSENKKQLSQGKGFVKSKSLVKKIYVAKSSEKSIYAVLEMKGTNTVDNYKLFAVEQVIEGTSTKLKKCQMDIAYIPTIEKSRWCKEIITGSHKGSVFVKCIWRDEKRKWEPMEVKKDVKLPSLMEDIRKDLVILEESESESDTE